MFVKWPNIYHSPQIRIGLLPLNMWIERAGRKPFSGEHDSKALMFWLHLNFRFLQPGMQWLLAALELWGLNRIMLQSTWPTSWHTASSWCTSWCSFLIWVSGPLVKEQSFWPVKLNSRKWEALKDGGGGKELRRPMFWFVYKSIFPLRQLLLSSSLHPGCLRTPWGSSGEDIFQCLHLPGSLPHPFTSLSSPPSSPLQIPISTQWSSVSSHTPYPQAPPCLSLCGYSLLSSLSPHLPHSHLCFHSPLPVSTLLLKYEWRQGRRPAHGDLQKISWWRFRFLKHNWEKVSVQDEPVLRLWGLEVLREKQHASQINPLLIENIPSGGSTKRNECVLIRTDWNVLFWYQVKVANW